MSELTCHLEKQGWGANISIEIFQLNQHWIQMPHFISSIIEIRCCFHPICKSQSWYLKSAGLLPPFKVAGIINSAVLCALVIVVCPQILHSTLHCHCCTALWVQSVQLFLEYFQCFSSPVDFAFGTLILPVVFFSSVNFVFGKENSILLTWIMVSTSIYSHLPTMHLNHSHRRCGFDLQENQMNCFYVSSSCIHHTSNLFYSFFLSSSILNLVALFWVRFTARLHCLQKLTLYPL